MDSYASPAWLGLATRVDIILVKLFGMVDGVENGAENGGEDSAESGVEDGGLLLDGGARRATKQAWRQLWNVLQFVSIVRMPSYHRYQQTHCWFHEHEGNTKGDPGASTFIRSWILESRAFGSCYVR